MHFDEEMGFQYLGPGITVLSPSDPRPPTVICLFAIFGLNGLTCSVLLFIASNFGSWYADCRAFCPGPSSYEDRTLAAWSKKKRRHRGGGSGPFGLNGLTRCVSSPWEIRQSWWVISLARAVLYFQGRHKSTTTNLVVSDSEQNDPPSSLVADAEQYELMQVAYAAGRRWQWRSHWVEIL